MESKPHNLRFKLLFLEYFILKSEVDYQPTFDNPPDRYAASFGMESSLAEFSRREFMESCSSSHQSFDQLIPSHQKTLVETSPYSCSYKASKRFNQNVGVDGTDLVMSTMTPFVVPEKFKNSSGAISQSLEVVYQGQPELTTTENPNFCCAQAFMASSYRTTAVHHETIWKDDECREMIKSFSNSSSCSDTVESDHQRIWASSYANRRPSCCHVDLQPVLFDVTYRPPSVKMSNSPSMLTSTKVDVTLREPKAISSELSAVQRYSSTGIVACHKLLPGMSQCIDLAVESSPEIVTPHYTAGTYYGSHWNLASVSQNRMATDSMIALHSELDETRNMNPNHKETMSNMRRGEQIASVTHHSSAVITAFWESSTSAYR